MVSGFLCSSGFLECWRNTDPSLFITEILVEEVRLIYRKLND